MDDANIPAGEGPALGIADEADTDQMHAIVETLRKAAMAHLREETFEHDLALLMSSAQIFSGAIFGLAVKIGLENATQDRMNQMGMMICANFEFGIGVGMRHFDRSTGDGATRQ